MVRVSSEHGRESGRGNGTLTVARMRGGFGGRDWAWNGLHGVFFERLADSACNCECLEKVEQPLHLQAPRSSEVTPVVGL
jgi:hypothetical protein